MFSKHCEAFIEEKFQDKMKSLPELEEDILKQFKGFEDKNNYNTEDFQSSLNIQSNLSKENIINYTTDMVLAMKYLYAFMPVSDMVNYSFEMLSDFADRGVKLWYESSFVSEYSEDIFLNYVLYHRVNSEEIASCRNLFYRELKEWIHGTTAKEVALEVNYWCAKEATYQSTDDRTMSALAVYESGSGRCGEESTFLVNALRSVGLPARQVYAPKWSHCDDNHAWVEVLIEGQWMFLGACEPEEVLNRGWFNSASSRAMLINSKSFSPLSIDCEAAGNNGMVIMENQIKRYAPVKLVHIFVKDESGNAVSGATVQFQVLNYSEFADISVMVTDKNGHVVIHLGLGSILVRAVYKDKTAEYILHVEKETLCNLVLNNSIVTEQWTDFDMAAPVDGPLYKIQLEDEVKKEGQKKIAFVTAKRLEKMKHLTNPELNLFLKKNKLVDNNLSLNKSMEDKLFREKMLESLLPKDKRDCKAAILEEHLTEAMPYKTMYPENIVIPYIFCPRIQYEPLTMYRRYIKDYFSPEEKENFCNNPVLIWEYIQKTIRQNNNMEYGELTTSPTACLKYKIGSEQSCKILFVAIARTLGIPARLNPIDGSMEFLRDNQFEAVLPKKKKSVVLTFCSPHRKVTWNYFNNWSIGKYEDGQYHSLYLGNCTWNDKGELSILAEPGLYRIITSNRLPNGNIFAKSYVFYVEEEEIKSVELLFREAVLEDMLENIRLFPFYVKTKEGEKVSVEGLTKEKRALLMFLEESKEPTEHILNEMIERKEEFSNSDCRIVFILRHLEALSDATLSKCLKEVPGIETYYDDFTVVSELGRKMYVDPEKLPLIIVTSKVLNGIYATSGYNVGTADLLLRIL